MFKVKIAIYRVGKTEEYLLFDIVEFTTEKFSELITEIRKWLDELGPY